MTFWHIKETNLLQDGTLNIVLNLTPSADKPKLTLLIDDVALYDMTEGTSSDQSIKEQALTRLLAGEGALLQAFVVSALRDDKVISQLHQSERAYFKINSHRWYQTLARVAEQEKQAKKERLREILDLAAREP